MRAMFLRTFVPSVVLSALLATPAAAQVRLDTALAPCYVVAQQNQRQLVTIEASGFTPFAKVDVVMDDILQHQADVLPDGTVKGEWPAPWEDEGTRPFTLRLSEVNNPGNTLTADAMVTRLSVEQSPSRAPTTQKVRFKGRGFMLASPVYAHYVFAGKVRKTVRMGVPKGPCGTFNVRKRQFPFKKSPSQGRWTIQFDQYSYYDPKAAVRVPMTVKVKKTVKPPRAQAR
jgi:hypothetical protein